MKAFVASTLLKKLIGPDADLFFDSHLCLISLRDSPALCLPQIARGADGGDRGARLSCLL